MASRNKWIGILIGLLALICTQAGAYDRNAAVAFAKDQWNVPVYAGHEYPCGSPERVSEGSAQPEYMCAEFVSRCLQAGGLDVLAGCQGFRQCISLYDWLLSSKNGAVALSADELQAGDLVFYKRVGSPKDWSHVALVIDSTTKNVAAHNNAHWDMPWSHSARNTESVAFVRIIGGETPPVLSIPEVALPSPDRTGSPEIAAAETPSEPEVRPNTTPEAPQTAEKPKGLGGLIRKIFGHKETKPAPPLSPAIEPKRGPEPSTVSSKPSSSRSRGASQERPQGTDEEQWIPKG